MVFIDVVFVVLSALRVSAFKLKLNRYHSPTMTKTKNTDETKLLAVQNLLAAHPELFARQGTIHATWRQRGGRRLGPYYSLRYRLEGQQCSVYLGSSKRLAVQVRRLLREWQQPRRTRLAVARHRAAVKQSFRNHQQRLAEELSQLGLQLKGNEVRGWRSRKGVLNGQ